MGFGGENGASGSGKDHIALAPNPERVGLIPNSLAARSTVRDDNSSRFASETTSFLGWAPVWRVTRTRSLASSQGLAGSRKWYSLEWDSDGAECGARAA